MEKWQRLEQLKAKQLYELHLFNEMLISYHLHPDDAAKYQQAPDEKVSPADRFNELSNIHSKQISEFKSEAITASRQLCESLNEAIQEYWETAGTFILPIDRYDASATGKKLSLMTSTLQNAMTGWIRNCGCECDEWRKDIDLARLELAGLLQSMTTNDAIGNSITKEIIPLIEEGDRQIEKAAKEIKASYGADHTIIPETIITESNALVNTLRFKHIPRIRNMIHESHINESISNISKPIMDQLEQLPDTYSIFVNRDFEHLPPKPDIETVSFRSLINEEAVPVFNSHFNDLTVELQGQFETALRNLADIDQILEFNIHAALQLAEERDGQSDEDAYKVLLDGIERTHGHIDDLNALFVELSDETGSRTNTMVREFNKSIHEIGDNEKVLELKLRLARVHTRKRIRRLKHRIWLLTASAIPVTIRFMGTIAGLGMRVFRRFRKITRLEPVSGEINEEIARYLTETQRNIAKLPYIYKQLFSLDPISDPRFFAGQEPELELLRESFTSWKDNHEKQIAVIGERGSGKTTFLNISQDSFLSEYTVLRINIDDTIWSEYRLLNLFSHSFDMLAAETLDGIEEQLAAGTQSFVCILENMHHLFLRTVTGFDTLERLLLFIQNTRHNVFWIVSCSLYGWQYLDKVVSIRSYFQNVIMVDTQSHEEMKQMILKRHRMSGYRLTYELPPALTKNRQLKKLKNERKRQAFIEDHVFKSLTGISAGNIRVAMLLWLNAVTIKENDQLLLSLQTEFDHTFIYQLPAEEMFTLAALIQHESLTEQYHAMVFRQEVRQSTLLLKRMLSRGLIQHQPSGYYVHPFLYRPVVEALRSKQMLQ